MKYRLVYTNRAVRDIRGLDTLARKRLAKRILVLETNPSRRARKLSDTHLDTHSVTSAHFAQKFQRGPLPLGEGRVREAAGFTLRLRQVAALGTYRYRIGDYRVIFDMDGKKVVILRIGHRREVYR